MSSSFGRSAPTEGGTDDIVLTSDLTAQHRAANAANVRLRQALHVDFLMASDVGGLFIVGWVDDSQSPLTEMRVDIRGWSQVLRPADLGRVPRTDVEAALGGGPRAHGYGFWAVTFADKVLDGSASCKVGVTLANGATYPAVVPLRCCTEAQLRTTVQTYLSEGHPGHGSAPQNGAVLARLLQEQRNRLVSLTTGRQASPAAMPRHTIEFLGLSESGGLMVSGWVDDRACQVDCVRILGPDWKFCLDGAALGRACRDDVQEAFGTTDSHPFAFWGFAATGGPLACGTEAMVELQTTAGATAQATIPVQRMSDIELRAVVLGQLAQARYRGNHAAEATRCLDGFLGRQIVDFNLGIARAAAANPFVQRFGQHSRAPRGSILVCLFGKPEFLALQMAQFCNRPGIENYEFVYVCNSPELGERLLNEAQIAHQTHGVAITLVLLPGNAGFGLANNVGVQHCRSDRILVTNPDVFPYQPDWAARHTALVESLPPQRTRLFGVPLYYDDGSLMHGGMYIESDTMLSVRDGELRPRRMLRVEHYGKGAPSNAAQFTRPRPVPAVTGAFISCDRVWFEHLGGFTETFVFGHYEDADLCLKSLGRGTPAWLHDIRLWHLEGKGSTRLPVHEGGSLVNRWLFSERWGGDGAEGIVGAAPAHALLQPTAPAPRAEAGALQLLTSSPHFQLPGRTAPRQNGSTRPAPGVLATPGRPRGRGAAAQKAS